VESAISAEIAKESEKVEWGKVLVLVAERAESQRLLRTRRLSLTSVVEPAKASEERSVSRRLQ
jgi:predicted protein tyrosine phosphatase